MQFINCKLHSVSVVLKDNDLAQFELCNRKIQTHFIQQCSPLVLLLKCGLGHYFQHELLTLFIYLSRSSSIVGNIEHLPHPCLSSSILFLSRGRCQAQSSIGASQQSSVPGAGGGEKHAEPNQANSGNRGGAEDALPRASQQVRTISDIHRQRTAGRAGEGTREQKAARSLCWSQSFKSLFFFPFRMKK